ARRGVGGVRADLRIEGHGREGHGREGCGCGRGSPGRTRPAVVVEDELEVEAARRAVRRRAPLPLGGPVPPARAVPRRELGLAGRLAVEAAQLATERVARVALLLLRLEPAPPVDLDHDAVATREDELAVAAAHLVDAGLGRAHGVPARLHQILDALAGSEPQ